MTVAAIEGGAPALAKARGLIDRFQSIVRGKAVAVLNHWFRDAEPSLIASFARGIMKDLAAVQAAVAEPWSNGQTEGHVNRLKVGIRRGPRWAYFVVLRWISMRLQRLSIPNWEKAMVPSGCCGS